MLPMFFVAYAVRSETGALRQEKLFSVMLDDPNDVLTMRSLAYALPEARWTQGGGGAAPSGLFDFLPSAVAR